MAKAIAAVQKNECTIREASEIYKVPKSTLHDRISGKVIHGTCSGPERYLTDSEEIGLVKFLHKCCSIGFARSKKQVMALVDEILQKKGKTKGVSNGWWESFRKRHPDLVLRTAEPLSYIRAMCTSEEILDTYFDMLEATLTDNSLLGKPAQIFNIDETGMPLDPKPSSVIAPVGYKHVSCMRSGDKTQITVVACCSASGSVIPPLVVFDRKFLKPEYTHGEVPGTAYALSDSGWITAKIFDDWFHNHFLCYAPPVRPILLMLDGHSSHYNPSVIESAAEEGVIIFCLPPHTTHLTQPLDKGCFGPLKNYWKEECQTYLSKNMGKSITRFQFSQVFSKAWLRGMTMTNVIAGFRTTGVCPFDRDVVKSKAALKPAEIFDPSVLPKETGSKFLPLYSPMVGTRQKETDEQRKEMTLKRRESSRRGCEDESVGMAIACAQEYRENNKDTDYTDAEINLYERRFEEGYNLDHDERYNEWVQRFHPSSFAELTGMSFSTPDRDLELHTDCDNLSKILQVSPIDSADVCCLQKTSVVDKLLDDRKNEFKLPTLKTKKSSCVLTSEENLNPLSRISHLSGSHAS